MKRSILYTGVLIILMCSSATMALVISDINKSGYEVNNSLAIGQLVYMDRSFSFTNTATLAGSIYIMTANADKGATGDSFLTFTINQDSIVYVAYDTRITTKPSWLTSSFTDTGSNLVTTDATLRLYSKNVAAGSVVLGGNAGGNNSMYSVVVVPTPVTAPPGAASNPSPGNNATNVSYQADLSWTAGSQATSQNVYFGQTDPPVFMGNQTAATYDPGTLELGTTYYWRIDSVNSLGITAGTVWSFTTQVTMAAGHWPMDDNAATAVVADIASTNSGTIYSGGVVQNTNLHHSADRQKGTGSLDFDGNDYVVLPRNTVFEKGNATTKKLTAMAWIKDGSGGAGAWGTVMGTGDGGWVLARNGGSGNVMTAGVWIASGPLVAINTSASISDGQWHHVALVYDGSSVSLYVDGVGTSAPAAGTIDNMSDKAVLIGENAGAAGRYWKGLIDDVKIYDYALLGEEIFHMLYPACAWAPSPADSARFTSTNPVLSWSAGDGAVWHDVYFGTSETAVANAQRLAGDISGDGPVDISDMAILAGQWLTDPGSVHPSADIAFNQKVDIEDLAALAADWHQANDPIFKGSQAGTTFDPGALTEGITYYWRIDEVNNADPQSPYKGAVWSFKKTLPSIKIMPLGDSITEGHYRYYLWNLLTNAGYDNLDFVGSRNKLYNNQTVDNRDYDKDHEGHFGQTDSYIASNVYGYLQTNPADIILLHIGTNGLDPSSADVTNILNEIDRYETNYNRPITVILAKIINRSLDEDPVKRATTTTFNNNVAAMAQTRIANGDDIIIVDMENGAGFVYTTSGDMYDKLHPNASGYQKMANVWFSTLQTILPAP